MPARIKKIRDEGNTRAKSQVAKMIGRLEGLFPEACPAQPKETNSDVNNLISALQGVPCKPHEES